MSEYVWELSQLSLKSIGVLLVVGAVPGFVYLSFVGISKTYAIFGIGFVAVPLLGTMLYLFRMDHKFGYGVSELCFAVVLAGFTIEQSSNSWQINIAEFFKMPNLVGRIFALSTSVYIFVRGWDNIGEDRFNMLRSLGKIQLRTVWANLLDRIRRRQIR